MKNIVLCFLIINIVKVNCGLLGDTLSPVTETVQNNALLDEHQHKNEEKKKGLLTNVVGGLDTGLNVVVDPLKKLLNQDDKNANKPGKLPTNDAKVDDKKPDIEKPKDTSKNTDDAVKNDTSKEPDTAKDKPSTPATPKDVTTDIPKTEDCTNEKGCAVKPKAETDQDRINVTRRINFDGSQCPTGTDRAHDDTCKEIQ